MNLRYLFDKNYPPCTFSDGFEPCARELCGAAWDGLLVKGGAKRTITIRKGGLSPAFLGGLGDIGWRAQLCTGLPGTRDVLVSLRNGEAHASAGTQVTSEMPVPVNVPALLDLPDPFAPADVTIEFSSDSRDLFLAMSRRLTRDPLYRLARGFGVEIGPGARPQIHNSDDTRVLYVEEKTAEEWRTLYIDTDTDAVWSKADYTIGKAHELPVEDGALDFVFSSHVFEHLHNPLGHLEHWRRKLKPGGVVLAVVPCADGTKDFAMPPTSLARLVGELQEGGFTAPLAAFERWTACHVGSGEPALERARKLHGKGFSIHVHVYDFMTINAVLRYAVDAMGYSDFRVKYNQNSKDFIFALKA